MQARHSSRNPPQCPDRQGAAAVEFAVMFPLFMMLVLGVVEIGRALDIDTILYGAVRESGRLASMDINEFVQPGQDPNDKVIQDIRNQITASGIDGSLVTITITDPTTVSETPFDLSDPNNKLKLFRITAALPYSSVSAFPLNYMGGTTLRASITMRLGRSTLNN